MTFRHEVFRPEYLADAHQLACLLSGCTPYRWFVQTRKASASLAEWFIVTTDHSTNGDAVVQSVTVWEAGQRLEKEET